MAEDTRYAYAVARIRALEKRLLDKGAIDRIIEARSPDDAFKAVIAYGYGGSGYEMTGLSGYEKILGEEIKKTHGLIKEIAPEPGLFDIFFLANDYHNIKVLLKAEFTGGDGEDALLGGGTIPEVKLKNIIRDRDMSGLHPVMRDAVFEALDMFNRTKDPQKIDIVLDIASFAHMKKLALDSGNSFLTGLTDALTDLINIKTFLRVKRLSGSRDFLQRSLLPGGTMDRGIFLENLEEPLDKLMGILSYKPYSQLVKGVEDYKNTGNLTLLERLSDNYIISYIKEAHFTPFGIEPLVGYLFAKEYEIKNLRIVMVGKMNGIPGDVIKERLRDTYV